MSKYLVFVLLILSSLLIIPAAYSSHDPCKPGYVEYINPETGLTSCVFDPKVEERIVEVQELQYADFQEHIKLLVNTKQNTSQLKVILLSPNPQDMLLPPNLENVILNSDRLYNIEFTNRWQCAPGVAADPCVLVQIKRDGFGEFTETIQKNTREVSDQIIFNSQFIGFSTKFHSIIIESEKPSAGIPALATAVYTTKYFPTEKLIPLVGNQLLDEKIRKAGGFIDVLNHIAENPYTEFSLGLTPDKDRIVRSINVSLLTSQLPEEITSDVINPIKLITASIPDFGDTIFRSKYFAEGFFPLNSLFTAVVITDNDYKVKDVNGGLILKIGSANDLRDSGWFFSRNSDGVIEGRYIFGTDSYVTENNLIFSITNNRADYLGIQLEPPTIDDTGADGGGCLIATAAFGSELAPQVQLLREIRDKTVLQTESGHAFMVGFNQFYYSFSPVIADYERDNPVFKETIKVILTPLLTSLTLLQYTDIDSESEMLGYGIGIILLNIGMYFVAPAVLIMKLARSKRN